MKNVLTPETSGLKRQKQSNKNSTISVQKYTLHLA